MGTNKGKRPIHSLAFTLSLEIHTNNPPANAIGKKNKPIAGVKASILPNQHRAIPVRGSQPISAEAMNRFTNWL
jgi:hypothetical protein